MKRQWEVSQRIEAEALQARWAARRKRASRLWSSRVPALDAALRAARRELCALRESFGALPLALRLCVLRQLAKAQWFCRRDATLPFGWRAVSWERCNRLLPTQFSNSRAGRVVTFPAHLVPPGWRVLLLAGRSFRAFEHSRTGHRQLHFPVHGQQWLLAA